MIILKVQKSSPDPPFDTPSLLSCQQNQLKPLLKPYGEVQRASPGGELTEKFVTAAHPPTHPVLTPPKYQSSGGRVLHRSSQHTQLKC